MNTTIHTALLDRLALGCETGLTPRAASSHVSGKVVGGDAPTGLVRLPDGGILVRSAGRWRRLHWTGGAKASIGAQYGGHIDSCLVLDAAGCLDEKNAVALRFGANGFIEMAVFDDRIINTALRSMPSVIQRLGDGRVLVCAPQDHAVVIVADGGRELWRFGSPHAPGGAFGLLAPGFAMYVSDEDAVLIADTLGCRVLKVDRGGAILWQYGLLNQVGSEGGRLWKPRAVLPLPGHAVMVADAGNERLVEVGTDSATRTLLGQAKILSSCLSHPRSAVELPGGDLLVADTMNDRIVQLAPGARRVRRVHGASAQLRWPRAAILWPDNATIFVADGRNDRLVAIDRADGAIVAGVDDVHIDGVRHRLGDPHHLCAHPDGDRILVTLASSDAVIEIDRTGRALRNWASLSDPHSAAYFADGIVVADSGLNRLVICHTNGWEVLDAFIGPDGGVDHFTKPRIALPVPGTADLLVADSGSHRLVWLSRHAGAWHGRVLSLDFAEQTSIQGLYFPRWLSWSRDGSLLIADTGNSRILSFGTSA
jgi:DNA-binding beta-propeller fold protein YncE